VPIGSAHLDPAALVPPTSAVSAASHGALVAADAYAAEALQWIETTTDELTAIPDDGRPLILVVDDNADMRRYFVRALSPRWRVTTASRGEDALAAARVNPPDLIVTDVMMPGLDGLELVEAVRADAKLADIPMVVVSARAGDDAAVEGLARGADDYIVKPFTAQTLVERVNAVLRGARRATLTIDEHERHQRRARAFNGLARALAEASTVDDAVRALLYARELLRFDKPSIALVDKRRNILRVHQWAPSLSQAVFERNVNQPLDGDMPYALTVNSNDVVTVQDWRTEPRFRSAVEDALASGYLSDVSVPLRDLSGDAFGALGFALTEPHEFVNDELDDVNSIAVMVARAVDRILRAEREHEIATVLQDELLEVERRSTTAAVCARYVASTQMLRVGGDWYTATVPGPGRVSVSVGDVVGSGVRAAAVMAQLRTALTAASLAMESPVAVLDAVNRYASSLDDAYLSTAAYALIDHGRQRVSYACAGHPYPLLVGPDGAVQLLDGGRREPLGITRESEPVPQAGVCPFPPGSLLLLYTDGLVERRGETLDDGLARLCDIVARQRFAPVAVVCDSIIAELCPTEGFHDDVAIVAVRPAGITRDGFVDAVEASAANYAPLRHRLREWLGELGVDLQLEQDIVLAVGEALVNAIEHGSNQLNAAQVVTVEAFVDGRELVVGVTDGGQWNADTTRSRRMNTRGRGLVLMYALMDEVDIRRSRQGTTVVMRRRLDGVGQEQLR
jgi:DNA-binding response OmpR family regulator/serine phosphatase RsbU (regulator of sigma subunit)/anti-sigma regulatory factor (Ser/Thr protein kinase)